MKILLIVTAIFEAVAGAAFLLVPAIAFSTLLNVPLDTAAGLVGARLAGAAIIGLAIGCWQARNSENSGAALGIVAAMLFEQMFLLSKRLLRSNCQFRRGPPRVHQISPGKLKPPSLLTPPAVPAWCERVCVNVSVCDYYAQFTHTSRFSTRCCGACATGPPRSYRCTGTRQQDELATPLRPSALGTTTPPSLSSWQAIGYRKPRSATAPKQLRSSIGPLPYTVSNCLYQHAIQQGMISSCLVPKPPTIPHVGFCGMVAWGPMMTSSVGLVAVV